MAKVQKSTDSSSLAEVVDRILDKGIVIDAWVKVSLVGIELLSIEARVVIASVETYLKYAEAIGLTATAGGPHNARSFCWRHARVSGEVEGDEAGFPDLRLFGAVHAARKAGRARCGGSFGQKLLLTIGSRDGLVSCGVPFCGPPPN